MKVLDLYVTRMLVARFALILLGVSSFVLAFEMIEASRDIMREDAASWAWVLHYAALRLPALLSILLPVAALVGALLTLGELMRHSELVAVWNAGVSQFRMMQALLPLGIVLAVLQFVLDDQVVPRTTETLREWGVGEYSGASLLGDHRGNVWLLSGNDVLRLPEDDVGADSMNGITIFRRDDQRQLIERLDARQAQHANGGWQLFDVTVHKVDGYRREQLAEMTWEGDFDVVGLVLLTRPARELSLMQLSHLVRHSGYGQRPVHAHRTWLHARISATLKPMLMIFLAVTLAQRYSRTGGFGRLLLVGIALGFSLFVFDSAAVAMGEVGFLPAALAAWAAMAVILVVVTRLALQPEAGEPVRLAMRRAA